MRWKVLNLAAAALAAAAPLAALADDAGPDLGIDFRYRFEFVDDDAFVEDAEASTLRTRFKADSGTYGGFSAYLEYDYIAELIWDDFNAGAGNTPDRTQFPTVADPEGGDLNQAWLQYGWGEGHARVGRTRIIYDNARFVGNVGWRQNEQTYDGFDLEQALAGWTLRYAYVDAIRRIFGDDVPAGEHDNSTHLVHLERAFAPGRLSLYYYDIDNRDVAAFSTRSFGARWVGQTAGERLRYTLEWALQTDTANNPVDYEAHYGRVDAEWNFGPVRALLGYEVLGGDRDLAGAAFRTPLATLHAFNGWADQFLTTPDAGLEDFFIGARGSVQNWSWAVVYHDFSAEDGPGNYGNEWDASLGRPLGDRYQLLFKLASFDGRDAPFRDVFKGWVQLAASF